MTIHADLSNLRVLIRDVDADLRDLQLAAGSEGAAASIAQARHHLALAVGCLTHASAEAPPMPGTKYIIPDPSAAPDDGASPVRFESIAAAIPARSPSSARTSGYVPVLAGRLPLDPFERCLFAALGVFFLVAAVLVAATWS